MNVEIRNKTVKMLEKQSKKHTVEFYSEFEYWLDKNYNNAESIRGIVIGCALFIRDNKCEYIDRLSEPSLDVQYNIEIGEIFLQLSNQYLNCVR